MAQLAKARMRNKMSELEKALCGNFRPHQRFLLVKQLAHIDFLDETIERLSEEIKQRLSAFEDAISPAKCHPWYRA